MSDQLPAAKQVRDTLNDLLGRDVSVQLADPPAGEDMPVAAVFVSDNLALAGVIGFDLALAAYIAAAIGLVPPGGAEAAVEDGELSPLLGDNLTEVCNVLAGLFTKTGGRRVKLHKVHLSLADIPADLRAHLVSLGNRLDLAVTVAGYGTGTFSLVVPL
jgi:hypothetical protein